MEISIDKIDCIGLGYGELVLKGKNRGTFEKNIQNRIRKKLSKLDFNVEVQNDLSKIYLNFEKNQASLVYEAIKNIFGINNISFCVKTDSSIESIKQKIVDIANELYEKGARSFKVNVNRANKNFEINSMEIAKNLGAHILINTKFEKVSMNNYDVLINVDIRKNTYIYTNKIKAYGGMPQGSAGNGISLISGGIDSPVASFMMSKRGLKLAYVTFHSFPFTSEMSLNKIESLVDILSEYNGKSKFFKLNILKMQDLIKKHTNNDYATILTRRVMMKLANMLCEKYGYRAIVTGESLGQVASQTLGGLNCTNEVVDVPVFRPLIGMDKLEIIDIANEIGTYEKSIEPHEDSCVLFAPKHPITNPEINNVVIEESKIPNYEQVLIEIFDSRELVIIND